MVTIKVVAAAAQVSIKTVSRVLNDEPGVADDTRERVKTVIERLSYVPNLSARRLKSGRSDTLALVLPRVASPYASKLLSYILSEARSHDYSLLVLEDNPNRQADLAFIERTILHRQVDGLLIAPPGGDSPELLAFVREQAVPIVLITPSHLNHAFISVEATDYIGALEATRYLLQLGHCRIAHITSLKSERFTQERVNGYAAALGEAGLVVDPTLICEGNNSLESGHENALRLLDRSDPPTAFFAANDEMAVGVMIAAWHRGLRVPEHLSVVGFDDAPIAEQVFPALTTVSQPIDEIARVAVAKLVALIEGHRLEPERIQVSTQLMIRLSCSSPI